MIDLTGVKGEQGRPYIDNQCLANRCVSMTFGKSGAQNDMFTAVLEVCSPTARSGETTVAIAGAQITDWFVMSGNAEAVRRGKEKLVAFMKACKVVDTSKLDANNPAALKSMFVGRGVKAEVFTQSKPLEENGAPVLGDDGQPIANNNYRVGRYIGAADDLTVPSDSVAY